MKRRKRLELANEIATAVGSELEPEVLFKTIIEEIRKIIPCDRCSIARFDIGNKITYFFQEDADSPIGPPLEEERKHGLMPEEVYKTKRPFNIPDILETRWRESRQVKAGYRSVLVIPILQEGECAAHVRLASKQVGYFTKEHEGLLSSIAGHLGTAIQNARLYEEVNKRADRLNLSNKISTAVSSQIRPDELFRTVVSAIRRAVQCARCVIAEADLENEMYRYLYVESDVEMPPLGLGNHPKSLLDVINKKKRPAYVTDCAEIDSPNARILADAVSVVQFTSPPNYPLPDASPGRPRFLKTLESFRVF
jgi:GAF domain-containing protein